MGLIEYLLFRPGPPGPYFQQWGFVLAGAYGALALALIGFGALTRLFNARHAVHIAVVKRIVGWGVPLQLAGLAVLGLRAANLPAVSLRLALFLHLAAEVAALVYLVWWLRTRYPEEVAHYEWEERKRDFLPRGGAPAARRRRA